MTSETLSSSDWVISVSTETSNLSTIRDFVARIATKLDVDPERIFDLKVAVSEACANAFEHSGTESAPLEVTARSDSGRLSFEVKDNGLFRPPSCAREDFGSRGLGLPLMVTLMDEVAFARTADGGTKVTLTVLLV